MPTRSNARLVYSTAGEQPEPRPAPAPASPAKGGVRIRLDRRASGRVVTVVTGLAGSASEVAALGRALRSACGAGGTVKDGALEIQGDHRDKVEAVLSARGLRSKRAGG
ncbi:MAG TPA: translation initiation factor [Vicinamibacteria bacterium]|nr:translation initiation factor [Vicinamibacteria bacterium]